MDIESISDIISLFFWDTLMHYKPVIHQVACWQTPIEALGSKVPEHLSML